jgi:hypothetical protein
VRPVVIWLTLTDQAIKPRKRLAQTLLVWLPYVLIMISFLVWRLILFKSPRGEFEIATQVQKGPLPALAALAKKVITDAVKTSLGAWADVFNFPRLTGLGNATTLLYLGVVIASIGLIFFYLWKYGTALAAQEERIGNKRWAQQASLLGGLALLVGGIPFWVTQYPIGLTFPWDRFTLPMAFGTSLLIAGLLELLLPSRIIKTAILTLLIALGLGFHITNQTSYRREWSAQKDFFWQLAWRAPGLKAGTTVMTAELPFIYYSDNSLTAPLNWLYAPEQTGLNLPYLFYNIESRQYITLKSFQPDIPIEVPYRTANFNGSTSQVLAVFYEPPGCVNIADPAIDGVMPQKPRFFSSVLPLSDPTRIITHPLTPARPPQSIFGPEPPPNWCYYFEKADLAGQEGDWPTVVEMADKALALNARLYEVNAPEFIPFIKGYAHLGRWDDAYAATMQSFRLTPRVDRMLCATWKQLALDTPDVPARQAVYARLAQEPGCKGP